MDKLGTYDVIVIGAGHAGIEAVSYTHLSGCDIVAAFIL